MPSRKLEDLYPPLKVVCEKALDIAKEKGLDILITCTMRTPQEQLALYAQGREPLDVVNEKRRAIGLYELTPQENSRKVTWVLSSYHTKNPSMAFDFAIKKDGKVIWDLKADVNNDEIPDYQEFGNICKSVDKHVEWGGDWDETPDYPHVQWVD